MFGIAIVLTVRRGAMLAPLECIVPLKYIADACEKYNDPE